MVGNIFLLLLGALFRPSANAKTTFQLNPRKPNWLINSFAQGGVLEAFNPYFGAMHHLATASMNANRWCDNIMNFAPIAISNSPPKITQDEVVNKSGAKLDKKYFKFIKRQHDYSN